MLIPFNQAGIATPTHPIHGQNYTYGYNNLAPQGCNPTSNPGAFGVYSNLQIPSIGILKRRTEFQQELPRDAGSRFSFQTPNQITRKAAARIVVVIAMSRRFR